MNPNEIELMHAAVERLVAQAAYGDAIQQLTLELGGTEEPFVWATVPLDSIEGKLPAVIRSAWIFLLKEGVPSGCHYHPNSIQHMIAINGGGRSQVGGVEGTMIPLGAAGHSPEEKWYIIGKGVPHEFFPEGEDMAVVSFHTCEEAELEEIACGTGGSRHYHTT